MAWLIYGVKYDKEVTKDFKQTKESFEIINEFVNTLFIESNKDRGYLYFEADEEGNIVTVDFNDQIIELSNEQIQAFYGIKSLFRYNFSFIDVTNKRISYGGIGKEMYAYSKDGKKPSYFYPSTNKKEKYTTYGLGGDWYYLILR